MQKINVFINGFGRIGRALLRALLDDSRFEVVGINDLYPYRQFAYLLQYDSTYGTLPYRVGLDQDMLTVAGRTLRLFNEERAEALGLEALGVDILFQCSGVHLSRAANQPYLESGAKKIILSAPPQDDMPVFVPGVNDGNYRGEIVVSAASCSANAMAPVLQLLEESAGIEAAGVSMIHSYTSDQRLLDGAAGSREMLRGRSATANILPLSSSAARTVGRLLPQIAHRIETHSIRVPVASGTLYDFSVQLKKPCDVQALNRMLDDAAQHCYHALMAVTDRALASTDIIGDPHGITVETARTQVVNERFVRVLGWQDNETGYVSQMIRLARRLQTQAEIG